MSKAIIAPSSSPRKMALLPCIPFSQVVIAASGGGHRFTDDVIHQQADDGGAEQRQDQHRFESGQGAR
jgi:hypothetical protein